MGMEDHIIMDVTTQEFYTGRSWPVLGNRSTMRLDMLRELREISVRLGSKCNRDEFRNG